MHLKGQYTLFIAIASSLSVTRGHTKSFFVLLIKVMSWGGGGDVFYKSRPEHIGGNLCASTSDTLYRPNETVKLRLINECPCAYRLSPVCIGAGCTLLLYDEYLFM